MLPPEGNPDGDGYVLKLKKSLYGLKQSPRNFNNTLNTTITNLGFKRCVSDSCIYYKKFNSHDMYMSIYFDDIIIACSDEEFIIAVKQLIVKEYKVKDMGVIDWYLEMRFKRDTTTGVITLDQSKYATDVITRSQDHYRKQDFTDTPIEENVKLSKSTEEYQQNLSPRCQEYIKKYSYRQVVGSLLYLAIWTRPDITFAVHTVAKHSNHPTLEAVHACATMSSTMSSIINT